MRANKNKRIAEFQGLLRRKGLDGYFVSNQPDLNFLARFSQEGYALLVGRERAWAFVPKLLEAQFLKEVPGFEVLPEPLGPKAARKVVKEWRLRKVGFDPDKETYTRGKKWKKMGFLPVAKFVSSLRFAKRADEIQRLRRACRIAAAAFRKVFPRIKPGRTEASVAREIEDVMKDMGAKGAAFEIIVASGPNSALPHYSSADRLIRRGEPVVIDFGCTCGLYHSDMTRTLFMGRPGGRFRKVYETVRKAQLAGIRLLRPGVSASRVDRACRELIEKEGFGRYFIHSTGHGVGVEVHEPPRLGKGLKDVLRSGVVVTVEPGIYLPGEFGVRIEDTVLVTPGGHKVLTK